MLVHREVAIAARCILESSISSLYSLSSLPSSLTADLKYILISFTSLYTFGPDLFQLLLIQVFSTKITISGLRINSSNSEILDYLKTVGVNFRSNIIDECYKDKTEHLTKFKTGRMFFFADPQDESA